MMILAQTGFPAPGSSGNFTTLSDDDQSIVLALDGSVAFEGEANGVAGIGLWFGKKGAVQPVALPGSAAPNSLLGAGYTWRSIGSSVEVNGSDELAYAAYLNGPGLNGTNSEFVVAGPPDAPRVIAQSGQPAPGIPGAFFQSVPGWGLGFGGNGVDYEHELIGQDGAVAFVATCSTNENNFGLWLAPNSGATPILIMHTGQQAPGTPPGVVFTNFFEGLPPFGNVFMNGRDEIVFLSMLTGPGVGSTNNVGIWQAEPDGTVNLVARSGDTIDVGGGVQRQIQISYLGGFGNDAPLFGGPEDGRPRLFNNRGQILFQASGSLFLAQTGIIISAELSGNDVLLHFPTLAGKNYEVDYKTNLSAAAWSVAVPSVAGTGGEVTVTNSIMNSSQTGFYQVVRTD